MKKLASIALLLLGALSASAQGSNGGVLYASDFAGWTLPQGNSPISGQIQWYPSNICQVNSAGYTFTGPKIGRPVRVIDADSTLSETVTPSTVILNGSLCSLSAVMAHQHYSYHVNSGTSGLQEAIDYAVGLGQSSVVVLTPAWTNVGGDTGMITAASGNANVGILDERTNSFAAYNWNGSAYVLSPFITSAAGLNTQIQYNCNGSFCGSLASIDGPGNINAASGTFSGPVSGTTGTFSGALSGTTGTFSGTATASNAFPLPYTSINMWGDSLTLGNQDGSGTTVCTALASLSGLPCNSYGIGGETSSQIAGRMGAVAVTVALSGGQIPASGGVTLTFTPDAYAPVRSSTSALGTISGIPGSVVFTGGVYTFTRTTPGSIVVVADGTPWLPSIVPQSGSLNIVWACTNNAQIPGCVTDFQSIQSYLAGISGVSYLFMGPLGGNSAPAWAPNGFTYAQIVAIEQSLQSLYPQHFINIREQLVSQFNPSLAGDNTGYANDITPLSLRTHYTAGTLSGNIDNATCSMVFTAPPGSFAPFYVALIDTEEIYISANSGGTVTGCIRGFGNSTAASHTAGVSVSVVDFIHLTGAGYTYVANQVNQWITSNPSAGNYLVSVPTATAMRNTNLNLIGSASQPSVAWRQYFYGTGNQNFAGGVGALNGLTLGHGLTAVGFKALTAFNGNSYMTAVGYQAEGSNTGTGLRNTSLGVNADFANISSADITAVGFEALQSNTALGQTAVGASAMQNSTTSIGGTAVGAGALQAQTVANYNTGVGYNVLHSNLTNLSNTGVGYTALTFATSDHNTAVGSTALSALTTGGFSTAVGSGAVALLTTNSFDVGVGYSALGADTAGSNTASGYNALANNTTGTHNTAMGTRAGRTGTSANTNVSGNDNTWLGFQAGPSVTSQLSNTIAIGSGATNSTSNQTVIGVSSTRSFIPYGTISVQTGTAPTVSSNAGTGSLTNGTDNAGIIATGATSTTSTLTFFQGWGTWASCTVSASNSTAQPFVSAISKTAVTFTYVTTGTPTLYYNCFGQ